MKFLNRISLLDIIKGHLSTFYDDGYLRVEGKKRVPSGDKITFIFIPAFVSLVLVVFNFFISEVYLNIILTCLSIFTGLLFGLLSLVFELTKNIKREVALILDTVDKEDCLSKKLKYEQLKYRISKELFINIGFSIVLAIFAIITAILTRIHPVKCITWLSRFNFFNFLRTSYLVASNFLTYFLLILFLLTILMILKRFFLLFESETRD